MTNVTVQEALKELLTEMANFCKQICNSEPNTTIKGEIESKAFYIGHHPLLLNPEAALAEVEASSTGISNNAIDKCEPVGEVGMRGDFIHYIENDKGEPQEYPLVGTKLYTSPISNELAVPNDKIIHNLWNQAMFDGLAHSEPYTLRRFSELLIKQLNTKG